MKNDMPISELRRDIVTGNWILIAKRRGARPLAKHKEQEEQDSIETCPFEDPQASGNAEPVLMYKDGNDWSLEVIPNKYPAFAGGVCDEVRKVGPYFVQDGRGFHEVIITRDHTRHLALLPLEKVEEVLRAYQERYLALQHAECVRYISIFHNHGRRAGASLTHPHSQLIAIPVLPSDIKRSLSGSNRYFQKHRKCVHCAMLDWEQKDKTRIVAEQNGFIALCPFISRNAYEVRILPKEHAANFEETGSEQISELAIIFHTVLKKLYEKLNNPAYNFYLHTAPADGSEYPYYHWHFEIRPKTEMGAGFEMGTGVEISAMEPEKAAEILRE